VTVGVDVAKDQLFNNLCQEDRNANGYCHFPTLEEYDDEFFAQLTSEKRVMKWVRGSRVWAWKKIRPRNEALDTRNYAYGALRLSGADVDKMAEAGVRFKRNLAAVRPSRSLQRQVSKGVSL
jgi:phage terminase large subunit GpA-like protein